MKIVFQTSSRAPVPSFPFLTVSHTETWPFKIGPVNAKTGRRAVRPFTGLVATGTEPFPMVLEKLRAYFSGRKIIAYLEVEGYPYCLNAFTTDRTEAHSFMKAAYELKRALPEQAQPSHQQQSVAVETTFSYEVRRPEIERLRKLYPDMKLKSIDPKNRTIRYILRNASLRVPKPQPVTSSGIAS